MSEKTSGSARGGIKSRFKKDPDLPARGVIRAEKARIFKLEGDTHVLAKIGQWLPKDRKIKAVGIEEGFLGGKPCTAVMIEVPDPNKPGEFQKFAIVKADVVLGKLSTKH